MYSPLELREIFHLEFLRWFSCKIEAKYYVLKGGVNLRFFFNSFRYSEDIDIDASDIAVVTLQDIVMGILCSNSFQQNFKPYSIEQVIPPSITKAKQTETTQRFKIHLITFAGEDLFTKIEFSQRGFKDGIVVQSVSNTILRNYKLPPLLVPHYNVQSMVMQKVEAIIFRSIIQARDIFDLYILNSQYKDIERMRFKTIKKGKLQEAREHILGVSFREFCDTVLSYLNAEDQLIYKEKSSWDEVKLKTAAFIDELIGEYA